MMGTLRRFDLLALAEQYQITHFVETGTGSGNGLAYAASCRKFGGQPVFKRLFSCEIEPTLAQNAYHRFRGNPRIEVISTSSSRFLHMVLPELPICESVLFWLDAHFPGADFEIRHYNDETRASLRLPAEEELKIIHQLRPLRRDVILMDDARIWLDDDFERGNLPDDVRHCCPAERNINFVYPLFDATHHIKIMAEDQGYVVLTPKHTDILPTPPTCATGQ
jgi:hypothetical protein